jgi:hypothetical protein
MGELWEALRNIWDMERALERGQKKEGMDPIMMDEEHTKEIMERVGVTCNEIPYQYNINGRKREVVK